MTGLPPTSTPAADPNLDYKLKRWAMSTFVILALALGAYGVTSMIRSKQASDEGQAWLSYSRFLATARTPTGSSPSVDTVSPGLRSWAELAEANRVLTDPQQSKTSLETAKTRFGALASQGGDSPAVVGILNSDMSVPAVVRSLDALTGFEGSHRNLLANPAPSSERRARLVTDLGNIEISFFPDVAPTHVKNFQQLVESGFYNGTKFHRISRGVNPFVECGDPNTKEGAVSTWGQGEQGDGQATEKNKLLRQRGVVVMAPYKTDPTSKKTSGSRFYIVTSDSNYVDRNLTAFGVVTGGIEIVDKIAAAETELGTERPRIPVVVTQASIF